MDLLQRPRRLRKNALLRNMVRETRISKDSLIYPMFLTEGENKKEEISSMKGQYRYSIDQMPYQLEALCKAGVSSVIFFGIPSGKDVCGSQAYHEDGIIQKGFREAKSRFPELYLIGDVCLCEYTSHGHCGVLKGNEVENDATLPLLAKTALAQVQAGADMVAPSDMMDGRVLAIRNFLDAHQYETIPIMSYAVKYASSFYGPFREAAGSAPAFGDRKSYQMDYHNAKEGLKEALLDVEEGADIIMVKPAMAYGDLIRTVANTIHLPVASYSVSGEYAMVKAAAAAGYVDETSLVCEMAVSAYRAGSSLYLTYYAELLAKCIEEGRIG